MASINLTGVLRDPLGEVSYGNTVKFTHETTTGETIGGFASALIVEINGAYDIDLEYGNVLIETYDKINARWIKHGTYTINSETPATSLPSLIGITTPLSDPELLLVQNLVADAEAAKNEAQTAQSNTEALFNDFDSSVADALADIGSDISFETTFNDSLSISKGYGLHDTITAGGDIVELPSKSVSFTCASARTEINKSGQIETVSVDSPSIGSDGLFLHGAYTVNVRYDDDLTQWANTSGVTLVPSVTSHNNASFTSIVNNGESMTQGIRAQSTIPTVTGEKTYISVLASLQAPNKEIAITYVETGVGFKTASVNIETELVTQEVDGFLLESVSKHGDMVEVVVSFEAQTDSFDARFTLSPATNLTSPIYVFAAWDSYLPFIKTTSSSVSVAKTIASIPAMNNLPSAGQPFAIEIDCAIPKISFARLIQDTLGDSLLIRRTASGESVEFKASTSDGGSESSTLIGANSDLSKWVFRVSQNELSIFKNGVLSASFSGASKFSIDPNTTVRLGGNAGGDLMPNTQIKNLRIHRGDVSVDTIKSWGGAK